MLSKETIDRFRKSFRKRWAGGRAQPPYSLICRKRDVKESDERVTHTYHLTPDRGERRLTVRLDGKDLAGVMVNGKGEQALPLTSRELISEHSPMIIRVTGMPNAVGVLVLSDSVSDDQDCWHIEIRLS